MNIQADYWWGQMYYGPPNQDFGWVMATRPICCSAPMHLSVRACVSIAKTSKKFYEQIFYEVFWRGGAWTMKE